MRSIITFYTKKASWFFIDKKSRVNRFFEPRSHVHGVGPSSQIISLLPLAELSDIFPSSIISVVDRSLSFDSFNDDDGIKSGGGGGGSKLREDGVTSPLRIVGWIGVDFGVWLRLFECDCDRWDDGESNSSLKN